MDMEKDRLEYFEQVRPLIFTEDPELRELVAQVNYNVEFRVPLWF